MSRSCLIIGLGYVGKALKQELDMSFDVSYITIEEGEVFHSSNHIDSKEFDLIFYCLPTPLNPVTQLLDTDILEEYLCDKLKTHPSSLHIITSTLPLDASPSLQYYLSNPSVLILPEFRTETLLESGKLSQRLVIGHNDTESVKRFLSYFPSDYFENQIFMSKQEARAVKLFNNAYLAMRVSFFNEMTLELSSRGLDPMIVIESLGRDERIGSLYSTPSLGYGGPCLPKDTTSLASQVNSVLIKSIAQSNKEHMTRIAKYLIESGYNRVGFLEIGMKPGSSSMTDSPVVSIAKHLVENDVAVNYYSTSSIMDFGVRVESVGDLLFSSDIVITQEREKYSHISSDKIIYIENIFPRTNGLC